MHLVLAAAAAVLVFVAGAEYGRRSAAQPESVTASLNTPLAIQLAGTEYVARVADFSSDASNLTTSERSEARQVALAILYAASVELLRESEDDDLLTLVARLIESRRQAERDPQVTGTLWF